MSTFQSTAAVLDVSKPDASKHVNYTQGMVLGADDFIQEFAYLSGLDQRMARDLSGYGTVCGLRVSTDTDARGPRVVVSSGIAVSPIGEMICVRAAQCAYLNDWLAANTNTLGSLGFLPPTANLRLFLSLSYRECKQSPVPIPGEPCRTEDSMTAASRIADDFLLELRMTAPDQREEALLREFVVWLRQVLQISTGAPSHTRDQFADVIRQAVQPAAGTPTSPPGMSPRIVLVSPPPAVLIPIQLAAEYLRLALSIWTTEIRPRVHAFGDGDAVSQVDGGLLLAQLDLQILSAGAGANWTVTPGSLVISDARRPILAHTRLLEEMLLHSWQQPPTGGGGGGGAGPLPADSVVAEQAFGMAPQSGAAATFSRSDHTHGTPPITLHTNSTTAHNNHQIAGDVTGTLGASTVAGVRGLAVPAPVAANDGQSLVFRNGPARWEFTALPSSAAGGDISGTLSSAVVTGLQKLPVTAPAAANDGQFLTFRNAPTPHWELSAASAAAGSFVKVPAPLPAGSTQYQVVAAGKIGGGGQVRFPSCANLRSTGLPVTGRMNLTFVGYDATARYVVKITGEAADGSMVTGSVVSFNAADFTVAIAVNGAPLPDANRGNVSLHIEISQY